MAESQILSVENVDVGINSTMPSNKVVWSTGRNIRFTPGFVSKTPGKKNIATLPVSSLNLRAAFTFVAFDGNVYTILCTDAKIYAANRDYTTISDITPTTAPTGGYYDLWEFCIVAGLPILTNGKDVIWKWDDLDSILVPLLNAPLAKHISCSMHQLVCSNIYMNGAWRYGRTEWSGVGKPEFWTIDKTRKSGYQDLNDYYGASTSRQNILCQISEGSKVYYFTEKNLWVCDFAQAKKQFFIVDGAVELASPKSACNYGGSIYAICKDDVYKYTNGAKTAIGLPIRKELYLGLNYLKLDTIFNFNVFGTSEVWFCVPMNSSALPDTAYIFNTELNNWTICDCDFTCHALQYSKTVAWVNNSGIEVTWENDTDDTISWLGEFYRANPEDIVCDSLSHINKMDSGYNALNTSLTDTAIYGYIETGDMSFAARPIQKVIEELFPELAAQTLTNSLMIQVGCRENLSLAVRWNPAVSFRIGIDIYTDLRNYGSQGAFIRLRFYTNIKDSPWAMSSYAVTYSVSRRIR